MTDKLVERLLNYGGRCRECADNVGICPASSLPCGADDARSAIKHVLDGLAYYTQHPEFLTKDQKAALESLALPQTDLEQRAREMLAAEYEREEMPWSADLIRAGQQETLALGMDAAIRAITKALASYSVPEQDSSNRS